MLGRISRALEAAMEKTPEDLNQVVDDLEKEAMKPVLREDVLYLGDNGRCFCARLDHAGMTAHFTGRDLSGHLVHEVTEADQREARRMGVTLADVAESLTARTASLLAPRRRGRMGPAAPRSSPSAHVLAARVSSRAEAGKRGKRGGRKAKRAKAA